MNKSIKSIKTLGLAAVLIGGVLTGCATTPDVGDKTPLAAAEVQSLVTGNSLYSKTNEWEYTAYFREDGTSTGKAWGSWGEEMEENTWNVTDQGLFCIVYKGKETCRALYASDMADEYVAIKKSGASKHRTLTFKFSEGNTYNY